VSEQITTRYISGKYQFSSSSVDWRMASTLSLTAEYVDANLSIIWLWATATVQKSINNCYTSDPAAVDNDDADHAKLSQLMRQ